MKFAYKIMIVVLLFAVIILFARSGDNASLDRVQDLQRQYTDLSNNYIKLQDKDKELQEEIDALNQRILILENNKNGSTDTGVE